MGTRGDVQRRDAFAVEDAFALRVELAIAREHPALDPRLRPFLDRLRRALGQVVDEAGLEESLAGLGPILEALAGWPESPGPWPLDAGTERPRRDSEAWADRRVLRFGAALNALWALCRGPDDPSGRLFARTAVDLGRRAGLVRGRRALPSFPRTWAIVNPMPGNAADVLSASRSAREGALGRPATRRIADLLGAAQGGLTAQEIATALGLHHTGVRSHLAQLEGAGVVASSPDPPDGRGRPPRRYSLTPDPAEREAAGHRELVRLLMSAVREAGFGAVEIERFGERQGEALVLPGGGPGEVAAAFERLGFAPREVGRGLSRDVILGRCPFAEGVEAPGGDLICVLHEGLARGMARAAAPGARVVGLDVRDPRRAGCRLRMAPAEGDRGADAPPGDGHGRRA